MPTRLVNSVTVHRALASEMEIAWRIIEEYYEAAEVVARDAKQDFAKIYFGGGSGLWLAMVKNNVVGCIALRPLAASSGSGEVKRLYVQPAYRGRGIAAALYEALEVYAFESGYKWLYLDTTDDMISAQRFYFALGYCPTPRYNDNPQATIFMRKQIEAPPQ